MRPADPALALYWDRTRLKVSSDPECDQLMVEYDSRRKRALDKDNTHKSQGVLPTREYKSRLAKSKALTGGSQSSERCEVFHPVTSRQCLKKAHPTNPSEHRF